jgi:hypothetical protein
MKMPTPLAISIAERLIICAKPHSQSDQRLLLDAALRVDDELASERAELKQLVGALTLAIDKAEAMEEALAEYADADNWTQLETKGKLHFGNGGTVSDGFPVMAYYPGGPSPWEKAKKALNKPIN